MTGANVHLKDNNGFSALDWAIHCKHTALEAALRAHIVKQEAEAAGK